MLRTTGRDTRGVLRGPRGPKKEKVFQELRSELLINVFDVLIGQMDDGRACMYMHIYMYIKHAYDLICQ